MKNQLSLFIIAALLLFACKEKTKLSIDDNDMIILTYTRDTVEYFDSYTLCKVMIPKLDNKKIIELFESIYDKKIQPGKGERFGHISFYDKATDTLKYEKLIDYDTPDQTAKKLLNLLEKECEDGVIQE
ncbi:MAG: hypothetical protein N2167_03855 [Flavobacteriales bacterium]|nr:hypothetical protein [Flavobacteriales bacterium]